MVGDRLDTDIEFGNAHGMSTLLLMSGVTSPTMLAAVNQPTSIPRMRLNDDLLPDSVRERKFRNFHRPEFVLDRLSSLRELLS